MKITKIIVIIIVILSACKSHHLVQNTNNKNENIHIQNFNFEYLKGKGKLQYKDGDQKISAKIHLRIRHDSLIWIQLSMTGIEGGRILISKDSVQYLDRLNKRIYKYTIEDLAAKYKFDFRYKQIEKLLMGNALVFPESSPLILSDTTTTTKTLTSDHPLFTSKFTIKADSSVLESAVYTKKDGKQIFNLTNDVYKPVEDQLFSMKRLYKFLDSSNEKSKKIKATINFTKIEMPERVLKFPFTIPSKYALIDAK